MLAHHHLWPPRKLKGKQGILQLIEHLGCIQYDTINVVGRNADLVLQSRIKNYKPHLLDELLYQDRKLIDGWDKMASIYNTNDWPYFPRRREHMRSYHLDRAKDAMELAPQILDSIHKNGPMSSLDFKELGGKMIWFWGASTSQARVTLETLYVWGKLGVHHKVNTRRVFDLIENLVPKSLLTSPDSNKTLEKYHEWHVLRRLGSMGLASLQSGEYWMGIFDLKSAERRKVLGKLIEKEKVLRITVEGIEKTPLFIRHQDLPTLEKDKKTRPAPQASLIAPLDNLIWNRKLIKELFNFEYVWEVYKPKDTRQYGYYTLPVLYGDQFVARMDAKLDRKTNQLTINGWWWEKGFKLDDAAQTALNKCMLAFFKYLGTTDVVLGEFAKRKKGLKKIISI